MSQCYYVQTSRRGLIYNCVFHSYTQVKSPALHDYTNIGRVIGYQKNTVQLPFVLWIDSNGILTLYVPVSFAVHPESSSHIGTCMTLGHGSMLSLSSKQKSNVKILSKARLIGVDNTNTWHVDEAFLHCCMILLYH